MRESPVPKMKVVATKHTKRKKLQKKKKHQQTCKSTKASHALAVRLVSKECLAHGPTLKVLAYLGQSSRILLRWPGSVGPPPVPSALNTMASLAALVRTILLVHQIEINELPTLTAG